ncbi:MAG: SCP2 sterol-binding domain-containing protein [Acidobacteriaceae bacterium]
MIDVQPYLQRIVERFSVPSIQNGLKGFTRVLLFRFTDTNEDWLIRSVDGREASLEKGTLANPDVTITTTTDVLAGVMDRKINGMTAYMQRKIQTKGPMEDLMKMQKLML